MQKPKVFQAVNPRLYDYDYDTWYYRTHKTLYVVQLHSASVLCGSNKYSIHITQPPPVDYRLNPLPSR